eukprot:5932718-Alexandrium_andersonii.AAC.1
MGAKKNLRARTTGATPLQSRCIPIPGSGWASRSSRPGGRLGGRVETRPIVSPVEAVRNDESVKRFA